MNGRQIYERTQLIQLPLPNYDQLHTPLIPEIMFDSRVARFGLLGALAAQGALGAPAPHAPRQAGLDEWLDAQEPIALAGVLANIGDSGSKAEGAAAGIVVASPSKSDPDCKSYTQQGGSLFLWLNMDQTSTRGLEMPRSPLSRSSTDSSSQRMPTSRPS